MLSDLGRKLFSKGNVQRTHHEFENEHECNIFCKFFQVPSSYVQSNHPEGVPTHSESSYHVCLPLCRHFVFSLTSTSARVERLWRTRSSQLGRARRRRLIVLYPYLLTLTKNISFLHTTLYLKSLLMELNLHM
jgi:hypothetical protein